MDGNSEGPCSKRSSPLTSMTEFIMTGAASPVPIGSLRCHPVGNLGTSSGDSSGDSSRRSSSNTLGSSRRRERPRNRRYSCTRRIEGSVDIVVDERQGCLKPDDWTGESASRSKRSGDRRAGMSNPHRVANGFSVSGPKVVLY